MKLDEAKRLARAMELAWSLDFQVPPPSEINAKITFPDGVVIPVKITDALAPDTGHANRAG